MLHFVFPLLLWYFFCQMLWQVHDVLCFGFTSPLVVHTVLGLGFVVLSLGFRALVPRQVQDASWCCFVPVCPLLAPLHPSMCAYFSIWSSGFNPL